MPRESPDISNIFIEEDGFAIRQGDRCMPFLAESHSRVNLIDTHVAPRGMVM